MNRGFAGFFFVMAMMNWLWPDYNGELFAPSAVSVGDGHIIGAIFIVGAAILWCMKPAGD